MAGMAIYITTYRVFHGKRAEKSPKADWIGVIVRHGSEKLTEWIGPPTPENLEEAERVKAYLEKREKPTTAERLVESPTFAVIVEQYLKTGVKLHRLASTTTDSQRTRLNVMSEWFGEYPLDEITPELLVDWWERFIVRGQGRKEPRSSETGQRYLSAMSVVYQYAAQKGHQYPNPTKVMREGLRRGGGTKIVRRQEADTRHPIETLEEVQALLEQSRKLGCEFVHLAILLQLDGGLRRGEAFATCRIDCILGEGQKDTTRRLGVILNKPNGKPLEAPKSGVERWLPMSWRLRCHVREFFALGPEDRPIMDAWPHNEDHFQRDIFAGLSKKAGLGRRTPKDLRDTFASHLLTGGIDPFRIMAWMGHAPDSYAMFRKRYAKYLGDSSEVWREPQRLESWEVPPDLLGRGEWRATFGPHLDHTKNSRTDETK